MDKQQNIIDQMTELVDKGIEQLEKAYDFSAIELKNKEKKKKDEIERNKKNKSVVNMHNLRGDSEPGFTRRIKSSPSELPKLKVVKNDDLIDALDKAGQRDSALMLKNWGEKDDVAKAMEKELEKAFDHDHKIFSEGQKGQIGKKKVLENTSPHVTGSTSGIDPSQWNRTHELKERKEKRIGKPDKATQAAAKKLEGSLKYKPGSDEARQASLNESRQQQANIMARLKGELGDKLKGVKKPEKTILRRRNRDVAKEEGDIEKGGEIDYDATRNAKRYNNRTGGDGVGARKEVKDVKKGGKRFTGKKQLDIDFKAGDKKYTGKAKTLTPEEIQKLYPDMKVVKPEKEIKE